MAERLSPLDTVFLQIEDGSAAHMHVGSVMVFKGDAPSRDEFARRIEANLHEVPRYRQVVRSAPGEVARPSWVDDPDFDLDYHVRAVDLPGDGGMDELRGFAGDLFGRRLDRTRPLWENWVVGNCEEDCWALVSKTHHCMIDGIGGVEMISKLFSLESDEGPPPEPEPWEPADAPSLTEVITGAVSERFEVPADLARAVAGGLTDPIGLAKEAAGIAAGLGEMAGEVISGAGNNPYSREIGPNRRFGWVPGSLVGVKRVKDELDATVNDVVLASVAGALRKHLARRGHDLEGVEVTVQVPVSIRGDDGEDQGNQVTNVLCELPVSTADPLERLRAICEEMEELKSGGQAVGAEALISSLGLAPPNMLALAVRGLVGGGLFDLTVTNVPGPQVPLYMGTDQLQQFYPLVPLFKGCGLGIAILSYDGGLYYGLVVDPQIVDDLDDLCECMRESLGELAEIAGLEREATLA
ncbi:MAG: WS/DGAT/MGAT family O-acyltransferase [Solirubrobacterales bacterium]